MRRLKAVGREFVNFFSAECSYCNDARRRYGHRYYCDSCWEDYERLYFSGKEISVCQLPNCSRRRYLEPNGRLHNYCGRSHAKEHRSMVEGQLRQQVQAHQQPTQEHQSHQHEGPSPGHHYPYQWTPAVSEHYSYSDTGPIRFYEKDAPYYEFTNFFPIKIHLDDRDWPTTEHYFQAQKFVGTPYEEKIRGFYRPRQAFDLSRDPQVSRWRRKDWEKVKMHVMYKALVAKFLQHSWLRQRLVGTDDRELIEHTPYDSFWGDGGDGTGMNHLGKLLMKVRSELREGKSQPLKDTLQVEQKQKQSSCPSGAAAAKSTATADRAAGGGSRAGQPSRHSDGEHCTDGNLDPVSKGGKNETCTGGSPSTRKKMAASSPARSRDSAGEAGMTPPSQDQGMSPQSQHQGMPPQSQHQGMPSSQHQGMLPLPKHQGMPPQSQHQEIPSPQYQDQGMPRQSQHQGMPPQSQYQGMPPHSQHQGMPPQSQHQGMPPQSQHQEMPPQYQHQGMLPQSQHQGMPPQSQHQGIPPQSQHQGMPPQSQHQEMPPQYQHQGMPPQSQHQGMPPQSQHQGMPPQSQHQGMPPQSQHQGMPPQSQHQGMPPQSQHQGTPPQYQDQVMPPQSQHQGMLPPSQDRVIPLHSQYQVMSPQVMQNQTILSPQSQVSQAAQQTAPPPEYQYPTIHPQAHQPPAVGGVRPPPGFPPGGAGTQPPIPQALHQDGDYNHDTAMDCNDSSNQGGIGSSFGQLQQQPVHGAGTVPHSGLGAGAQGQTHNGSPMDICN